MLASIRPHNEKAARLWGSGGRAYDPISRAVAGGILHGIDRLDPQPGERILDIATGTGLAARELAGLGARVSGVDIAEGMLAAAREIAAERGLNIDFRLGDAEALPYEDRTFDAAISTYGIMFTADPQTAAAELARVLRPGGRMAIIAWTPDSNAAVLRQVAAPFGPPPPEPPPPSPFIWGTDDGVRDYLSADFDVAYETGTLHMRFPDGEAAWRAFAEGFGPVKMVTESLDARRRQELADAFIQWSEQFRFDLGVAIPAEYRVIAGRRK